LSEEPGPAELRKQLLALETRLERAQARSETLTTERRELRRRLDAAEKDLERLQASTAEAQAALEAAKAQADERGTEAEKLSKQIDALVEENRRLAERLEAVTGDLESYREAALGREEAVRQAREETEATLRAEFAKVERKHATETHRLEAQIASLEDQVREQGKVLHLPPERVADLVNGLVSQLRVGMPGMRLREGELRLQVGFAGTGERAGFVVPTPDSGPEIRDSLHEVVFRFDRLVEPPSE
jgi:chromosome segregation ATPase